MIYTAHYQVEWKPAGSWVDITPFVQSVEGDFQTTGSGNGFAFGDSSNASAKISLDVGAAGGPLDVSNWSYVPIRVTFTAAATTAKGVAGIILDFEQDGDAVTFSVVGFRQLI